MDSIDENSLHADWRAQREEMRDPLWTTWTICQLLGIAPYPFPPVDSLEHSGDWIMRQTISGYIVEGFYCYLVKTYPADVLVYPQDPQTTLAPLRIRREYQQIVKDLYLTKVYAMMGFDIDSRSLGNDRSKLTLVHGLIAFYETALRLVNFMDEGYLPATLSNAIWKVTVYLSAMLHGLNKAKTALQILPGYLQRLLPTMTDLPKVTEECDNAMYTGEDFPIDCVTEYGNSEYLLFVHRFRSPFVNMQTELLHEIAVRDQFRHHGVTMIDTYINHEDHPRRRNGVWTPATASDMDEQEWVAEEFEAYDPAAQILHGPFMFDHGADEEFAEMDDMALHDNLLEQGLQVEMSMNIWRRRLELDPSEHNLIMTRHTENLYASLLREVESVRDRIQARIAEGAVAGLLPDDVPDIPMADMWAEEVVPDTWSEEESEQEEDIVPAGSMMNPIDIEDDSAEHSSLGSDSEFDLA